MAVIIRICKKCKEEKSEIDFVIGRSKSTGRESISKTCRKCYDKVRKGKERNLEVRLRKYGWDIITYNLILQDQKGVCAGCLQTPDSAEGLHVDHCHKTDKPRGLLCRECNLGMGLLQDNPKTLSRLANYLEKYNDPRRSSRYVLQYDKRNVERSSERSA